MKLPNGYGTVFKMSGNRRRPWIVKKSINGKQKYLGYFISRKKAFDYLIMLNGTTPAKEILFSKLYADWKETHNTKFGKDNVFVVWFCKTLQNCKVLVSTSISDGMYYEVTFDGNKRKIYLDAYKKWENRELKYEDYENV